MKLCKKIAVLTAAAAAALALASCARAPLPEPTPKPSASAVKTPAPPTTDAITAEVVTEDNRERGYTVFKVTAQENVQSVTLSSKNGVMGTIELWEPVYGGSGKIGYLSYYNSKTGLRDVTATIRSAYDGALIGKQYFLNYEVAQWEPYKLDAVSEARLASRLTQYTSADGYDAFRFGTPEYLSGENGLLFSVWADIAKAEVDGFDVYVPRLIITFNNETCPKSEFIKDEISGKFTLISDFPVEFSFESQTVYFDQSGNASLIIPLGFGSVGALDFSGSSESKLILSSVLGIKYPADSDISMPPAVAADLTEVYSAFEYAGGYMQMRLLQLEGGNYTATHSGGAYVYACYPGAYFGKSGGRLSAIVVTSSDAEGVCLMSNEGVYFPDTPDGLPSASLISEAGQIKLWNLQYTVTQSRYMRLAAYGAEGFGSGYMLIGTGIEGTDTAMEYVFDQKNKYVQVFPGADIMHIEICAPDGAVLSDHDNSRMDIINGRRVFVMDMSKIAVDYYSSIVIKALIAPGVYAPEHIVVENVNHPVFDPPA